MTSTDLAQAQATYERARCCLYELVIGNAPERTVLTALDLVARLRQRCLDAGCAL